MKISFRYSFAVALITASTLADGESPSFAEPAYRAADIVSYFSPQATPLVTRSLCIGAESECGNQVLERPRPDSSFDLRVNFDFNSIELNQPARSNLDEFVRALMDRQLASHRFFVEGHTDGAGRDQYNLELSIRRANAVTAYLIAHGVRSNRLEAKGYGKQKPLVPDPLAGMNRRVETRIKLD